MRQRHRIGLLSSTAAILLGLSLGHAWAGDFMTPGGRAQVGARSCELVAGVIRCKLPDEASPPLVIGIKRVDLYNTVDTSINYERGTLNWTSNVLTLATEAAGTGTGRDIQLTAAGGDVTVEGVTSLRQADAANAGGRLQFLEDPGTGNNFIAFLAPSSITSDVTCTLENDANPIPDSCVGDGTDGGGGGSPGGSDTHVQFNDGGAFGGDAGLTYNKTTDVLTFVQFNNANAAVDITGPATSFVGLGDELRMDFTATADANPAGLSLYNDSADTTGNFLAFYSNSASPAAADTVGSILFYGNDDGGTDDDQQYARISGRIVSTNNADERGALDITITGDSGDAIFEFETLTGSDPSLTFNLASGTDVILTAGSALLTLTGDFSNTTSGKITTGTIELGAASDTTLARSAGGEATLEGDAVKHAGKQVMWIPATAMKAAVTSGAGCGEAKDSGGTDILIVGCNFDPGATEERADFQIAMPKSWDEGTVTFKTFMTDAGGSFSADSTMNFELSCAAVSNSDAMNVTYGTAQSSSATINATGDLAVGAESSAITCGGTPAEADLMLFRISRDTSVDTSPSDALLIGIQVFWTDNASTLAE